MNCINYKATAWNDGTIYMERVGAEGAGEGVIIWRY